LTAIENQMRLVLITHLLLAMAVPTLLDETVRDEKALRKQDQRQRAEPDGTDGTDGTDRPDWAARLFRHTSKISRQVLRFFKHSFLKPASPAHYGRYLRPMLLHYLRLGPDTGEVS
ncbi:hypothetical protein, partial [Thiococcus pfennigii]|uniref:hypothetical protein n=1 Tax=Thiococcus pfennigii TaxID=1057 RepID=UPI001A91E4D8